MSTMAEKSSNRSAAITKKMNMLLYYTLVTCTKETAFVLVQGSTQGNGLEALILLRQNFGETIKGAVPYHIYIYITRDLQRLVFNNITQYRNDFTRLAGKLKLIGEPLSHACLYGVLSADTASS